MRLEEKRVLVTGGAGFIGSHLVDRLVEIGVDVSVLDNLSSGSMDFLSGSGDSIELIEGDMLDREVLGGALEGRDVVFHLAANPDVRVGAQDTTTHFDQNIRATYVLLERMRELGVGHIGFSSTSAVYGETPTIPTPEDYGPLLPISLYAASKLACEAMISSYCHTFDMHALIYRFANAVGPRSTHGVSFDFVRKLREDPERLEILGRPPGTVKSYVHVEDCISGMLAGLEGATERVSLLNIGSADSIDVKTIADIVCSEMGLESVEYDWTGGVDGGRGWLGDVKEMRLSINALRAMGWEPRYTSEEAMRAAVRSLLQSQ